MSLFTSEIFQLLQTNIRISMGVSNGVAIYIFMLFSQDSIFTNFTKEGKLNHQFAKVFRKATLRIL